MKAAEARGDTWPGAGGAPERAPGCDVCGGPTFTTRCKIVCRRCGYTRDCSDP